MRAAILDQRITSVSYDWDGEDNASPSVQQVNGAVVCRNMANNPRFIRTSGTVGVSRNLFNNPGAAFSSWQGFGAYAGVNNAVSISVSDASWSLSGKACRRTWTTVASPNSGDISVTCTPEYAGVLPSTIYTVVFKTTTDGTVSIGAPSLYDNTLKTVTHIARSRNVDAKPLAGEVVTDWVTFITPETMNGTRVPMNIRDKTAGCWAEQSEVDIYPGTYQPNRQWFSGSYSPDPDLTPVWIGTANASQSYLRGFVPSNTSVNVNFAVSSSNGVRLIPNNTASNDSLVNMGGSTTTLSGLGVTFTPGKWYGFQAVCTLLAPQTGTLSFFARRMRLASNNVAGWTGVGWTGVNSACTIQQPNEAGSYQVELVTQLPPDSVWAILRLHNGASFGNGDVYWDKLLIVEGDTEEEVRRKLAQGYFDGDTQVNAETINGVKL